MNIKHYPKIDTERVCKLYSERDGVDVRYVCTSAINSGVESMDIFYRETPHPEFGNRYFGLFFRSTGPKEEQRQLLITNADKIEELEFAMIENDSGELEYSENRWDYKKFENGNVIDGGRSYIRGVGGYKLYKVKDGEFVEAQFG